MKDPEKHKYPTRQNRRFWNPCQTHFLGLKKKTCPDKRGRLVTLVLPYIHGLNRMNRLISDIALCTGWIFFVWPGKPWINLSGCYRKMRFTPTSYINWTIIGPGTVQCSQYKILGVKTPSQESRILEFDWVQILFYFYFLHCSEITVARHYWLTQQSNLS